MPEDGRQPGSSAYATLDGKVFVIGGALQHSGLASKTVSYFDVGQYCWRLGEPLNVPRSNCTVAVIGHKLYVFGGFTSMNSTAAANEVQGARVLLQTAEVYDPFVACWRIVSTKIPTQIDYSIAMNEKFFAIGTSGQDIQKLKYAGNWIRVADVMGTVYDPHTNKWTQMACSLMESWGSRYVDLNGRLYTSNGCQGLSFYDSSKNSWQKVHIECAKVQFGNPSKDSGCWSFIRWLHHFQLLNLGGKLCMVGIRRVSHQASIVVLEMEEHFSENSGIRIEAKVVMLEDVTRWIRRSGSGICLQLEHLLSCQMIDA